MKVVLTKDVRNTGRAHSVIEVADGHALNFLIPRGLALPATAKNLQHAEHNAKQAGQKRELDQKLIEERIAALADGVLSISKKANDQGHLYDGVDAGDIAKVADLPEDAIHLEKPIKELGSFDVPVAVGEGFGSIKIEIVAE